MRVVLTVVGVVLAALLVLALARGQLVIDLGGPGAGPGEASGTGGATPEPPPPPVVPPVTTSATPDSVGTPAATFRGTNGSDRVDCANIASELSISAYSGGIRWTATSAPGVSISPSSGVLDDAESVIVRIGGTYTGGGGFTVVVSAPNPSGSGSVNAEFTCA